MKIICILIFIIINVSLCCKDPNQVSLLPPFHDKSNIQSIIGEDINIICCHPDGADSLSWQDKFKNEIVFKSSDGVYSLKDEKSRLILRIDNISDSKTGEYTCTNTKRRLSKTILISARKSYLTPEVIKKFIVYPTDRPIQIKCPLANTQGIKSWIYTRHGKRTSVTKSGGNELFTINDDMSLFTMQFASEKTKITMVWCQFQEVTANGDVKTGLYEFTWESYEPIDVKLVIDTKGPILEGNDVKFICSFRYFDDLSVAFPFGTPVTKNMELNNDNLIKGEVTMTIKKITKDMDGTYICKITKFIAVEQMKIVEDMASVDIVVLVPPKIISNNFISSQSVKISDKVSLMCQIKSAQLTSDDAYFEFYQRDSSQWLKLMDNDEKYDIKFTVGEINTLKLVIKNVTWNDRGKYRCVAKNAAGADKQNGLLKVEKTPELISSVSPVYMSTKPVRIDCGMSGYPISSSEDIMELNVLTKQSPLAVNVIDKRNDDIDGFTVIYEVIHRGELLPSMSYELQCYYKNTRTNAVFTKTIELKVAERPNVPTVQVVCSGSSGVVFMYELKQDNDKNKQLVKNIVSYAPAKEFDSMTKKPSIVIPIRDDERTGKFTYVVRDLVASRNYTFRWEGFNVYGLSNERILSYNTKNIMLPPTPEKLHFSPVGNKISVNVSWTDGCPYAGSNNAIRDVAVSMKPLQSTSENANNMQWIERNFTFDMSSSSLEFLISLENPKIDYEIQVSMRSAQGSSAPLTGTYTANTVLAGSLFSCFPRCAAGLLSYSHGLILVISVVLVLFTGHH